MLIEEAVSVLQELFNQALSVLDQEIPGRGLLFVILLFKKGLMGNLANWHPILLSNTDFKLLTNILPNRVMKVAPLVIHPSKFGFFKGRRICDNIYMVQNVI